MAKSKPHEPLDTRPVPPSVTQVFETVTPPLVVPAPADPLVVDEDKSKPGPDRRTV